MLFPVECQSCHATAEISAGALRTAASLRCQSCGSDDLDLYDGKRTAKNDNDAEEAHSGECWTCSRNFLKRSDLVNHVRTEHNREPFEKQAASSGTGWGHQTGDPLANWNEYVGPPPGPNPGQQAKEDADDTEICPVCHGTKRTQIGGGGYSEGVCRNCHGTGRVVSPTGQPQTESLDAHVQGPIPGGAGWVGRTSAKVTVDGHAVEIPVTVMLDREAFAKPAAKKAALDKKTAKINKMATLILKTNDGLTKEEAHELARRSVEKFPED
jgi:hypothetical protein